MTAKNKLVNLAKELNVPPSAEHIPAILAEMQAILETYNRPAFVWDDLFQYWSDLESSDKRNHLVNDIFAFTRHKST